MGLDFSLGMATTAVETAEQLASLRYEGRTEVQDIISVRPDREGCRGVLITSINGMRATPVGPASRLRRRRPHRFIHGGDQHSLRADVLRVPWFAVRSRDALLNNGAAAKRESRPPTSWKARSTRQPDRAPAARPWSRSSRSRYAFRRHRRIRGHWPGFDHSRPRHGARGATIERLPGAPSRPHLSSR